MSEVDKLVSAIKLPIAIPDKAFLKTGQRLVLADFEGLVNLLPEPLPSFVNLDATSSRFGQDTFQFTLYEGGYLRIRISGQEIVELERVSKLEPH